MAFKLAKPYSLSLVASWRFLALGLALSLCLVWAVGRPELRDPRELLASAKERLQDVAGSAAAAAAPAPAVGRLSPGSRPLVLFAYAESPTARVDLAFFVRNGLHGRADFVFVFNGPTNATEMVPTNLPNVWTVQRNNSCFDMGAMGEVLRADGLWRRYRRFITMNASLRGPFVPVYSTACWTDAFLDRVTDTNKLVGLSVNCFPRPHVQSMLWATDAVGMALLLDESLALSVPHDDNFGTADDPVGLSPCYPNWFKAVHAEVGTTELITAAGYTVDVMLTSFHGQPADSLSYCNATGNPQDHFRNKGYFGSNIHPYETIFYKANRKVDGALLDHMTDWHMAMERTSWDTCGR